MYIKLKMESKITKNLLYNFIDSIFLRIYNDI